MNWRAYSLISLNVRSSHLEKNSVGLRQISGTSTDNKIIDYGRLTQNNEDTVGIREVGRDPIREDDRMDRKKKKEKEKSLREETEREGDNKHL